MKVFLATFGSYGDVRPFLWMGGELMAGGHDVLLITNPVFRKQAVDAGIPFLAAGTEEDYRAAATPAARTGSPVRDKKEQIAAASRLFTRLFLKPSRDTYDAVAGSLGGADAVVFGHFFAFGAKLAAERHGLPFVNVCLSPHWLKSFVKPGNLRQSIQRFAENANTRFIDSRLFTEPFNALRNDVGLGPMQTSSLRWMFGGPNLCLYPRRFQDFPIEDGVRAEYAGFPPSVGGPLPGPVEDFLRNHGNPIVFTAGSSIGDGASFFRAGLDALNRLGLPGIFLVRDARMVPDPLPESVLRADFAPLGTLLGRCAAIVHHGGVGTAAAALECGKPQLICHRTPEQRENARILKGVGVGETLAWQETSGDELARLLKRLLDNPAVHENGKKVQRMGLTPPDGFLESYLAGLRQN